MTAKNIETTFNFKPFSQKQRKVLNWWADTSPVSGYDGIIADGAIRSGKSLVMSLSFVLWGMNSFTGQNFAMCGKSVGSFRRNVLFWLKIMLRGRRYETADRRADNLLVVKRGNVENYFYIFGGKDERSQDFIQGITLAGVFFDEVALMPESFVNQATGRCSVNGSKMWFNCNPGSPQHWFKLDWIDQRETKNLLYLHFTMDDNLALSEQIKHRYRSMYTGVFYDRYILGLWRLAEGLVYANFGEDNITDEDPPEGEYYISIDYGTHNPFSAGLWNLLGDKAVRIAEYYHSGRDTHVEKTVSQYVEEIKRLAGGREIQQIVVDPSALPLIVELRQQGFLTRGAKNDVVPGINMTATMLNNGNIKIHRRCRDCIREFGLYRWDENSTVDTVVKENDHAMDDVRYFVTTVLAYRIRTGQGGMALPLSR